MAVYDANLMLRSTTNTVVSAGGVALVTGSFVDLGSGGVGVEGLSIRASVNSADVTTTSMTLRYDFSDDGTNVLESITAQTITGTTARAAGGYDQIVRFSNKRKYVRYVATLSGAAANFGVVTIGVEAGDISALR